MNGAMLEKLVRYERPERSLPYAQGMTDAARAAVFGAEPESYAAAVADFDRRRDEAAERLAAKPGVRSNLAGTRLAQGQLVLAIGESTTADRLSWFELLAALFAAERPELGLRFENLAVSGSTTTQALAGVLATRRHVPDLVFCMLGANDARRFGGPAGDRLVSAGETERNLRLIRRDAVADRSTPWVWLAPTPVDESAIAAYPYFGCVGLAWTNDDVREASARLADLAEPGDTAIDPADAPGPLPLLDDGVHPHVDAQIELAAHVLARLR